LTVILPTVNDVVAWARRAALQVLDISASLEKGVVVPYGQRVGFAAVGLTVRARRLSRSIIRLTDCGEWLEAQILVRALLEYVITLQWILKDPEKRVLSWWQADDRPFARMVSEVTAITGQPIEITPEETRALAEFSAQIALEAASADVKPFPSLRERAAEVDADLGYSLLFRLYSQGGVHPYGQALLPLLEDLPDRSGVLIRETPGEEPIDDPYYLAGVLLLIALEKLAEVEPGLRLPDLEEAKLEFLAMKHEIDARG
jgi:hypothetical protein